MRNLHPSIIFISGRDSPLKSSVSSVVYMTPGMTEIYTQPKKLFFLFTLTHFFISLRINILILYNVFLGYVGCPFVANQAYDYNTNYRDEITDSFTILAKR